MAASDIHSPRMSARRTIWSRWSAYPEAVWTLGYGALGLYWWLGGNGFPFGPVGDPEADVSALANVTVDSIAPVIALAGLGGSIVALAMAKSIGTGVVRNVLALFGCLTAITLAFLLTDLRVLMLVTRVIVTPVFAFTGIPGGGSIADFYTWPRLNLVVLLTGGVLWGLATLAYWRRGRDACGRCGRTDRPSASWTTPGNALRWGRWAAGVAVAIPLVYGVSRIAMALGSPFGVPQSFYDEMEGTGVVVGDLFMASMAMLAAVLTIGLVRPWGEVFPRWIWFAAGKRVPPRAAIIPATVMSIIITTGSVAAFRSLLANGIDTDEWGITGPMVFWPLWGPALAAATYAYHLRRRMPCPSCRRGATGNGVLLGASGRDGTES